MPVVDFAANPTWNPGHHDVVIVGSGAAGLYLASILAPTLRVVVVESGHFSVEPANQALNEIESTGKPMASAVDGRKRAVGGTTVAWGGQSLPFSAVDFERRDWVPGSGWPIDRTNLWKNYQNANRAIGVDDLDYEDDVFRLLRIKPPPFDRDLIRFHVSKWSPNPNFRRIFAGAIERDFTVVSNCTLLDVEIEGDAIRAALCGNRAGARTRFPCSRLIIACGGLESTRLLLWLQANHGFLSASQDRALGTGFLEHPCVDIGVVDTDDPYRFQRRFNTQIHGRRKYSLRLSGAESWQRRNRLLNVTAAIAMKYPEDPFDPYVEYRTFANLWARRGKALRAASRLGATAMALVRDRFVYKQGALASVCVCAEEPPTADSAMRLGEGKDPFGVPRLSVHWKMSPLTWETTVAFAGVLRSEIARLGCGTLELRPELLDAREPRFDLYWDIGHHMGGTSLGTDPACVVDPDLRIRGLANAWVCSGSVFPTGSHSNPTLTVLALADRLARSMLPASR